MSALVSSTPESRLLPVNTSGASTDLQLIDIWLRSHRSENTRQAYSDDIVLFFEFLWSLPARPQDYETPPQTQRLAAVTVRHLQAWSEHLTRQGAPPSTAARRLSGGRRRRSLAR